MAIDPCILANISADSNCTEILPGVSPELWIMRKSDLKVLPQFKKPASNAQTDIDITEYCELDDTPGFEAANYKQGRGPVKWGTVPGGAQHTFSSNGDRKGFTQHLIFKLQVVDELASVMCRRINNATDRILILKEGEKYQTIYDPERDSTVQIDGDSGTTPDSDSGISFDITLISRSPKTYYAGTFSTEPGA